MATTIRRSLLVLLSALGVACGGDPATPGASDALDEATLENERHADVCRHAGSMSVMLDDVARHELAMNGLVTRMGDMMVHPCSDEGTHHMSQELTDTNAEVAQHSKQMRAAGTLGAGHFECTVHAHELGERLESMRNALGSMSCAR